MKRIPLILIAVLALSQLCGAQAYSNQKLIYLDENGQPTKEKKAALLQQVIKLDDTLWETNLYQVNGPRVVSYHCSDPEGRALNGEYLTYSAGQVDTTGYYSKGVRAGVWTIHTPGGRVAAQQFYMNGQLFRTMDSVQLKHHSDSLNALLKVDSSKVFTKVEIESSFPGGGAGWLKYLEKNLRYPDKAVKNRIQGRVIIAFIVDKEGHIPVNSVFLDHSVEFSIDQEALRIIFVSPDWTPAVQNGRNVKSYKKQPIIFRFS